MRRRRGPIQNSQRRSTLVVRGRGISRLSRSLCSSGICRRASPRGVARQDSVHGSPLLLAAPTRDDLSDVLWTSTATGNSTACGISELAPWSPACPSFCWGSAGGCLWCSRVVEGPVAYASRRGCRGEGQGADGNLAGWGDEGSSPRNQSGSTTTAGADVEAGVGVGGALDAGQRRPVPAVQLSRLARNERGAGPLWGRVFGGRADSRHSSTEGHA